MDSKSKFTHIRTREECCKYERSPGVLCRGPKVEGTDYCRHHFQKSDWKNAGWLSENGDLTLDSYEDIVRWKKETTQLVRQGSLNPDAAQQMHKLLSSLAESMEQRDKADPDKLSKRIFSAEAAIQAARQMTGEQAAKILRAGNFLDFLQNLKPIEGQVREETRDKSSTQEDSSTTFKGDACPDILKDFLEPVRVRLNHHSD